MRRDGILKDVMETWLKEKIKESSLTVLKKIHYGKIKSKIKMNGEG